MFLSTRQEENLFSPAFHFIAIASGFWWCSCLLDLGLSCFPVSWCYWAPGDERRPFPRGCPAWSTVSFAEACKARRAVSRFCACCCVRGRRADAGEQHRPWLRQGQSSSRSELVYMTLWALACETSQFPRVSKMSS